MSEPHADPVPAPPAAEIEAAARGVVGAAMAEGLRVRLMGGLAIRIQSFSAARPPYERSYRDFDLVAHGRDVAALRRLLEREGYVGDKLFNAIHGAQRLVYTAADGRWSVDVVIDQLAMSHTIELKDRLATDGPTLDLADLLLSKLQIWETNRKDLGDAVCLLADHPLAPVGRLLGASRCEARQGTDRPRPPPVRPITRLGFSAHTVERKPGSVAETCDQAPIPVRRAPVDAQVVALLAGNLPARRRSPSAGRPAPGSASASAGTRPPRKPSLAGERPRPRRPRAALTITPAEAALNEGLRRQ